MSQHDWILKELKRRPITALDAFKGCGTMKLATRISELRRNGHLITTEIVTKKGKTFARYRLIP
jgi:hypothetical protein